MNELISCYEKNYQFSIFYFSLFQFFQCFISMKNKKQKQLDSSPNEIITKSIFNLNSRKQTQTQKGESTSLEKARMEQTKNIFHNRRKSAEATNHQNIKFVRQNSNEKQSLRFFRSSSNLIAINDQNYSSKVVSHSPSSIEQQVRNEKCQKAEDFFKNFKEEENLGDKQLFKKKRKNQTEVNLEPYHRECRQQVQFLKKKLQVQIKQVQCLSAKIDSLNKQIAFKDQTINMLSEEKHQLQTLVGENERRTHREKSNSSNHSKQKEIENFMQQMDKNFDEMLSFSKLHESDDSKSEVHRYQETIASLRERVNYLEVETNLLRKFKFEVKEWRTKCEKLKGQVKILQNKMKLLSIHLQQGQTEKERDLDYSVSFEFSEEKKRSRTDLRKFHN